MTELLYSLVERLGAIRPILQFVSMVRTTKSFGCEVERHEERSEKNSDFSAAAAFCCIAYPCVWEKAIGLPFLSLRSNRIDATLADFVMSC